MPKEASKFPSLKVFRPSLGGSSCCMREFLLGLLQPEPHQPPHPVSECGDGQFGQGCERNCSCHHGVCDQPSGKCLCRDGWTGDRCDVGKGSSFCKSFLLTISHFCQFSIFCLKFPVFCRPIRIYALSPHLRPTGRSLPSHALVQIILSPPTSVPCLLRK